MFAAPHPARRQLARQNLRHRLHPRRTSSINSKLLSSRMLLSLEVTLKMNPHERISSQIEIPLAPAECSLLALDQTKKRAETGKSNGYKMILLFVA
jgi:hypothetical protein